MSEITIPAEIPELSSGSHVSLEEGACIMEAVSYVAGEPWSDSPACACPVISAFLRNWNDNLSDVDRDRLLRPLIPLLVGSRGSDELERRRAVMAADWLIRIYTPAWLRLAKLNAQADALAGLPEIIDFSTCPPLMPTLNAVRADASAARDAARDAAGDAAGAVAWAAAGAAAWAAAGAAAWAAAGDAAGDAAGAAARAVAWDAARDAAWDAARDAAWDAARAAARAVAWAVAWDAAGDALKPTVADLQQSALALAHRMIAAKDGTL